MLSPFDVSVIVVNYNCSATLAKCVSNLLNSEGFGELLLVDNGSVDRSLNLIEKYTIDKRLKIIRLGHNVGLPKARNIAASKTKSKFIAFVDADSFVAPDWLSAPCFLLESYKEIGAVQCNIVCSKHSDRISHDAARVLSKGCRLTVTPAGNRICTWQWLFPIGAGFVTRRDAWDSIKGFDPDFFVGNDDVDFGVRLWLNGYQVVISSEGTVYHEGGKLRSRRDISSIFMFHSIKTTFWLWTKDLGVKSIISKVLPFSLLYPFMAFWRGGLMGLKGFASFIRNFPMIISSRYETKRTRKISDKDLEVLMSGAGLMPLQLFVHDFRNLYTQLFRRIAVVRQRLSK